MLGYDFRATASWNHVFNDIHITNFFAGTEINSTDRSKNYYQGWGMQYSWAKYPTMYMNSSKKVSKTAIITTH